MCPVVISKNKRGKTYASVDVGFLSIEYSYEFLSKKANMIAHINSIEIHIDNDDVMTIMC